MRLSIDAHKVVLSDPDGEEERMAWAALREVMILTTDEGPFACDFFWVLVGDGGSEIVIAQEVEGSDALLERLQQLPDFDHQAVIDASYCTTNNKFLCWKSGRG